MIRADWTGIDRDLRSPTALVDTSARQRERETDRERERERERERRVERKESIGGAAREGVAPKGAVLLRQLGLIGIRSNRRIVCWRSDGLH